MPINTKPLETGTHYRTPNKCDKYENPWDNLAYALLCSAMKDLEDPRHKTAAVEWLDNEGRDIYEYLKTRPLRPVSDNTYRKRNFYAKKSVIIQAANSICFEVNENENNKRYTYNVHR